MNFHPLSTPLRLSLLFIVLLTSCAEKPTEKTVPQPKEEKAQLVGRIASIHKNPDFALIQSYGPWKVQTGAILATIGPDGRAANLKVTGEKTGQFAAADVQSGTLEIGDSVYTTLSIPISEIEEDANETLTDPQKSQVNEPPASTGEAN
jgi:hypothetical protein